MNLKHPSSRRRILRQGAQLAAAVTLPALSMRSFATTRDPRALTLVHTHTSERLDLVYAVGDRYLPDAIKALSHFLRDHYSGTIGTIDPQVFDLLHQVRELVGGRRAYEIISGYRCPATNTRLRETRGGGVARQSLHMEGRAIDVRLPGVALSDLRDAAQSLRAGGVGYYAREQFVHLDTGRVRSW